MKRLVFVTALAAASLAGASAQAAPQGATGPAPGMTSTEGHWEYRTVRAGVLRSGPMGAVYIDGYEYITRRVWVGY